MNNYTEELKNIFKESEKIAINLNNSNINTIHILLATLSTTNSLTNILNQYNINPNLITKELPIEKNTYTFYSKELLETIENVILSLSNIEEQITLNMILNEILSNKNTLCYNILKKNNINIETLKKEISKSNITSNNVILKTIGRNLNELSDTFDPVIGREKEITKLIEILKRKNKNNPLLLGEAGVGKTSVVEELARLINKKQVPNFLKNNIIYEISIASLVAGTKYRGEFEEKLTKLINELEANNNIILFIDEIHTLMGAGGAEGAIDASNILKPALARGKIKLIGATTLKEYKDTIENDKALDRRFKTILINEPNHEETLYILHKIKPYYEQYHNIKIPNNIIELTAKLSNKYIKNKYNPDKSIDILDEISAITSLKENKSIINKLNNKINTLNEKKTLYIKDNNLTKALSIKKEITSLETKLKLTNNKHKNIVTKNTLKKVLENNTNSTILELVNPNYFKNLKEYLLENIYDQEHIINNLIKKLTIYKDKTNNLPLEITLKGPTGTGKTHLVNILSKYLKTNLITLNMKEYNNQTSITKLIGSSAGYVGYNEKNSPLESIKHYPNSIILLENYNYTNTNIKTLFDSIITTGKLNLSNNTTINFENTIIIKTITEKQTTTLGFIEKQTNKDSLTFNNLSKSSIIKIITKQNKDLNKEQINNILKESNHQEYNAKNINHILNENLMNINEVISKL